MTKRILIVEDSPTQAERLRLLLTRAGYAVEVARTGREGIKKAEPDLIDLVISDVTMPEMDGFEFCTVMKALEATRRVPIILLTARSSPADIIKGLQSGADNFIPKPYEDDYLLERVQRISEQLEQRRGLQLEMEVNLTIGGRRIAVTADRQQIMELLFSTFEEMGRHHEELARVNRDLEEAKREADRANQAKSEFLSRMSHELRTPLNAILGFGQLLELGSLDQPQTEAVEQIMHAGRHLLALINEVLDVARVEAGKLVISPEPVGLADAVMGALALVAPLAAGRDVELRHELGTPADTHVHADRGRLTQVLLNLLSNAIKYNRRGGVATVSLQAAGEGRLQVRVRDEGEGIAAESLERLFIPFDRLGAEASEVEGTGLGLALSKSLVEAMGGTLSVEASPGSGATFTVELAAAGPPQEDEPAFSREPRLGAVAQSLPSATILYVEDNLSNVRLVEQLLAGEDEIELISARLGSQALDLAQRHNPDLILLDLHLPDMDGIELLERLRTEPATRATPVVVLSADATDDKVARVMGHGARDYLTKPLDLRRFHETLATILNE